MSISSPGSASYQSMPYAAGQAAQVQTAGMSSLDSGMGQTGDAISMRPPQSTYSPETLQGSARPASGNDTIAGLSPNQLIIAGVGTSAAVLAAGGIMYAGARRGGWWNKSPKAASGKTPSGDAATGSKLPTPAASAEKAAGASATQTAASGKSGGGSTGTGSSQQTAPPNKQSVNGSGQQTAPTAKATEAKPTGNTSATSKAAAAPLKKANVPKLNPDANAAEAKSGPANTVKPGETQAAPVPRGAAKPETAKPGSTNSAAGKSGAANSAAAKPSGAETAAATTANPTVSGTAANATGGRLSPAPSTESLKTASSGGWETVNAPKAETPQQQAAPVAAKTVNHVASAGNAAPSVHHKINLSHIAV